MARKNGAAHDEAGAASRGAGEEAVVQGTAAVPAAGFPIVGLGASAGGLEAFENFFHKMPPDSGMAFVLVQHLDPSHASILTEILQRSTEMPVVEAEDQMAVAPNCVYVIPPNRDMVIFNGHLQLSLPAEPRGQRMPIDAFLRSLAEDRREAAVGIILSGTGTDGTLGMRAIFGAGGLCLVQEPATAKYDGMPSSAIRAGYASQVLVIDKMAHALQNGVRASPLRAGADGPTAAAGVKGGLNKILSVLRSGTGHDFSQYKKSTVGRRIERRMTQHNIEDAQVYARYLKEHATEQQALFRELLINVTSFFRDPASFVALKNEVFPALLADKPEGYVLRVWVAGCATGEEAYSVAMVLRELADEAHRDIKVQLYSTDLDDSAISTARAGLYPPNIVQDVSPERLNRFFLKEDGGYRVKKEIREMVVFAIQSIIRDPPFTRLDLLVCRNLMIYLEPELQNRLIPAFHYAIRSGGVLFLSPSESVGNHTELFEPIDRKWKFYRAKPTLASARAVLNSGLTWAVDGAARLAQVQANKNLDIAELARRTLLQSFAPAAVVTDLSGNVLYVHGDTGRFLRPAPGHPTHNIVEMARDGLAMELRQALRQAATQGTPTLDREVTMEAHGGAQTVILSVRLLPDPGASHSLLLVSFQEAVHTQARKPVRKPRSRSSAESLRVEELENELVYATQSMQAMLEEQQATNEELQSTNEELQSSNEELETSKEELQSVNEELVTVNSELQTKIEQMASIQDDMKNLLDNIRLGTIFLDRHLRIRRFTRDASKVYRLVASDVGRPLADIRCDLLGGDLLGIAQGVLDSLVPVEREATTPDGTWYLARIQPYRTLDNVIDGVVMTFFDVTERVHAIAARKTHELAGAIVDTVHDPLVVLDNRLRVIMANRSFYREFGGSAKTTADKRLFDLADRQWDQPQMHDLLETVLPRERSFERRELLHELPGGALRRLRLSARRIVDQFGVGELVLLSIEVHAADKAPAT